MINKVIFSIFVICTVLQQSLYFTYTFMIHIYINKYTFWFLYRETCNSRGSSHCFWHNSFYLLSSDKIINNTKCYLNPPPPTPCKINLKSGRCLSWYILYIIIIQLKTLFPQFNSTEEKKQLWNFKRFQRIKVYEI